MEERNFKRIYISGGISEVDEYMENFDYAEKELKKQGEYDVIYNPADMLSRMPIGMNHEEYMKVCLVLLNQCDAIYMLDGWETSCGAQREHGFAEGSGIKIIYEVTSNGSL